MKRLVADLEGAGATVRQVGAFEGLDEGPLRGGVRLCVDSQEVTVYVFKNDDQRAEVTSQIDRRDPTTFYGERITAVYEWSGKPRFWERDRILVLYLGRDQKTERLLTSVLGPPFARGRWPATIDHTC